MAILERLRRRRGWTIGGALILLSAWFVIPAMVNVCRHRRNAATCHTAVLRLNVSTLPSPVAIGTSQDLRVGQKVFAIGNPFGLDWTLTTVY